MLKDKEDSTKSLTVTIQSIFQIALQTIYKDNESIKNFDEIQTIFQEKVLKRIIYKEFEIIEVIKEIKEKLQVDKNHKEFLDFIFYLLKYLTSLEDIDLSYSKELINNNSINNEWQEIMDLGNETKDIIDKFPEKNDNKDKESSFGPLYSILAPDFNITKIEPENLKEIIMDDIFFFKNSNWKNDIKYEAHYKKYPSLLYFLCKNPGCEEELREFLLKNDSIKDKEKEKDTKFPTFLLIFRIF